MECLLNDKIYFTCQALKCQNHYGMPAKCQYLLHLPSFEMPKSLWNAYKMSIFASPAKLWNTKITGKWLLNVIICFTCQALKRQNHYEIPTKCHYLLHLPSFEMPKSLWNACWISLFASPAKLWNAKITVKYLLNVIVCFTCQALKCQNHHEMPAKFYYLLRLPSFEIPKSLWNDC